MGAARKAAAGPRLATARLAEPPAGQRPQARDGRRGPADPRPHDRDVPRRPRLLAAPVPHPRTRGVRSIRRSFPTVAALGPDATQAIYSNRNKDFSQQGWAPVIGPFFNRGLMLLDFEEHMFHRRIMQEAFVRTRLAGYTEQVDTVVVAGDRQRLGGQRRAVPALSGDEGAHPRHRLDGVHGPRAGHRPRAGDQGEQGVHHHHPRGQRDHPHRRAAVHVVARAAGPRSTSRTTSQRASRSAAARTAPTC